MAPTTSEFPGPDCFCSLTHWPPVSSLLNEIMPMIYKRFTEKAAEEWRQIYKVCHPDAV